MTDTLTCDICVIGGGAGGLSVAAGASQMGADVILVEPGPMGGDCLNYGCVPSKSMLACAHAASAITNAGRFGVHADSVTIKGPEVYKHVRSVIAAIAPLDSVERFEGLGVRVICEKGKFLSPTQVQAGTKTITAKRFVIATGSSAMVPPIDGLNDTPYLTNETIFSLDDLPRHLVIIGGGPIGVELAQAHRLLGVQVSLLELSTIMPKDDPEAVDVVRRHLQQDGITLYEGIKVIKTAKQSGGISVSIDQDGAVKEITGSHLLVATGRKANVAGLDLEKANIRYSPRGIEVDQRLRTSTKTIFAIGDVAGGFQFTHKAGYDAGIIIRNILFRLPAKADYNAIPWVTYTTPELAQVGLSEQGARHQGIDFKITRWPFHENDRAQAEGTTSGFVKVITTPKGKILGATIVGPHAGELIQTWCLALGKKLKMGDIAAMIAPYPTLGEINKRCAGNFFAPTLFSEKTKKFVRFLLKFG